MTPRTLLPRRCPDVLRCSRRSSTSAPKGEISFTGSSGETVNPFCASACAAAIQSAKKAINAIARFAKHLPFLEHIVEKDKPVYEFVK